MWEIRYSFVKVQNGLTRCRICEPPAACHWKSVGRTREEPEDEHEVAPFTRCYRCLTPFVSVDSNAISLNLWSTTIATQVKSRDVTAFAN